MDSQHPILHDVDAHLRSDSTSSAVSGSETATLAPTPQSSGFTQPGGNTESTATSPRTPTGSSYTSTSTITPDIHPFRTLVLCFDGTGDQFDSDNSNIVELFSILKKDDPSLQMVYYQAGIGTYTIPQIATPFWSKISKTLDEMIAWNLDAHIMGGYEFLMENYRAGDRICIFGFSRGAYTARCLAGMIHKVGLLPAGNHQQVPFAYKMYTQVDEEGWEQSNAFKRAFAMDVDIEFVGVWDTVNSVGLIPRRLPFASSNTIIKTFRHALSLDERRAKFKANTWNRPDSKEKTLSISDQTIAATQAKPRESSAKGASSAVAGKWSLNQASKSNSHSSLKALEAEYNKDRATPTDVYEVWFSGCHCDVGGGSVTNGTRPNLARIPLRWMIRECFKTKSGILFDTNGLRRLGLDPSKLYPEVAPKPEALPVGDRLLQPIPPKEQTKAERVAAAEAEVNVSEEQLDLKDALSPVYDQLSLHWFWWLLEFLPIRHRFQLSNDSWIYTFRFNFGRGRHIPRQEKDKVNVHRSVQRRLEARFPDGTKYTPKADLKLDCVKWVD